MNRNFPAYQQDEGLRRIAVLLLALADLAEQAACRSLPVRFLVLWLLRPAEEAARGFATKTGYVAGPPVFADGPYICPDDDPHPSIGNDPDAAASLASMFRALAAFFFDLSCEASHLICFAGRQTLGCPTAGGSKATWLYGLLAGSPPRYADTS